MGFLVEWSGIDWSHRSSYSYGKLLSGRLRIDHWPRCSADRFIARRISVCALGERCVGHPYWMVCRTTCCAGFWCIEANGSHRFWSCLRVAGNNRDRDVCLARDCVSSCLPGVHFFSDNGCQDSVHNASSWAWIIYWAHACVARPFYFANPRDRIGVPVVGNSATHLSACGCVCTICHGSGV